MYDLTELRSKTWRGRSDVSRVDTHPYLQAHSFPIHFTYKIVSIFTTKLKLKKFKLSFHPVTTIIKSRIPYIRFTLTS